MPEIAKETVALLTYLLPGFLVAWLFYSFTSYAKPPQPERIIQALIFTLLVSAVVVVEKLLLLLAGRWYSLGTWDKDTEVIASVVTALLFGLLVAHLTNKDTLHGFLRKFNLSTRSASPSEWCTVFSERRQFVVLHLKDNRRLYGWPLVWPSDPEKGHIFITSASWVHGDTAVELNETEGVLIDVKEIGHIEFANLPKESS